MDAAKAMSPNKIPAIVLKACAPELVVPLAKLFQYSGNTGIYTTIRKIAQVCPVHKKQGKSNPIITALLVSSWSSAKWWKEWFINVPPKNGAHREK